MGVKLGHNACLDQIGGDERPTLAQVIMLLQEMAEAGVPTSATLSDMKHPMSKRPLEWLCFCWDTEE